MQKILVTILLSVPLAVSPALGQVAYAYVTSGVAYLGVGIRDVAGEDVEKLGLSRERGVYITDVEQDSPAGKAGIQEADVILEYSGVQVLSARQFQRMVEDTPRGREVEISVFRDSQTMSMTAEVGSRRGGSPGLEVFPDLEKDGVQMTPFERGLGVLSFSGKPRLGIRGDALTEQLADYFGVTQGGGVLIAEVIEGTPAEKAGLKAGDVIISANGVGVASVRDLAQQLEDGLVELGIVRQQRVQTVTADWRQLEFPATTNGIPRFFRADPDHEGMVKDQQVRRLVKLKKNEKTLTMAAAKAGLSRKTARKYLKSGKLPSQCQPERYWRTRSDPFESVWPEVEEILKRSPTVEATAVFEYLCRQQEGAFQQGAS